MYILSPIANTVLRNATGYFSFHYRRYFRTPPLCFASQNIGEVARSDGGVKKQYSNVLVVPHNTIGHSPLSHLR